MEFRKSKPVSLKAHATCHEKWPHSLVAGDRSIPGLGDLTVKDVERRQPGSGRLDLLPGDPETLTRYEVEIQLGATGEAPIIRTIGYRDIGKARYPRYEHVAVLAAEDVTSRFLNVISLFSKAIPLIAIQLRALGAGGVLTVSAIAVLDLARPGTGEDGGPGQTAGRGYWISRGSEASVAVADRVPGLVNEIAPGMVLKYGRHCTGLARDGIVGNFVEFRPRREHAIVQFRIPRGDEAGALINDSGADDLACGKRWGCYRLRMTAEDTGVHPGLLLDLIRRAGRTPPAAE